MKKVKMTIREFLSFRVLAESMRIHFTYGIKNGEAIIRADRQKLAELGY